MAMVILNGSAPDDENERARKVMRQSIGPQMVDQMIRQALNSCWMMLPEGRRNVQALKIELQRILDRAIANFQEDSTAFGFDAPPAK